MRVETAATGGLGCGDQVGLAETQLGSLERWAERILTARSRSLDEVLA